MIFRKIILIVILFENVSGYSKLNLQAKQQNNSFLVKLHLTKSSYISTYPIDKLSVVLV